MGVQAYIQAISNGRGMAKSNLYSVYFEPGSKIITHLSSATGGGFGGLTSKVGGTISQVGQRVLIMCDEVALPGVQANTSSVVRHPGANPINYPTNPLYTDLQLSFMCDAEMQALNMLTQWHEKIHQRIGNSYRLQYPEEYECDITIEKNERNSTSEVGLTSAIYRVRKAWPYAIDSVPLSYGSSQLVKVTANFYYKDWDAEFFRLNPIT
jgi:hypothetical protein